MRGLGKLRHVGKATRIEWDGLERTWGLSPHLHGRCQSTFLVPSFAWPWSESLPEIVMRTMAASVAVRVGCPADAIKGVVLGAIAGVGDDGRPGHIVQARRAIGFRPRGSTAAFGAAERHWPQARYLQEGTAAATTLAAAAAATQHSQRHE